MLTQTDAVLVAHAGDQPWPAASNHPVPAPLEARTSALQLLGSGVFGLLLAAMIGYMLYENAQSPEAYQGWRLWVRVLAAAGIAALGIGMLGAGIRATLQPQTLVSLSPAGLKVPGLYREVVPWSEVRLVVHDKPRVKIFGPGRIVIGIRDGSRFGRVQSQDLRPPVDPDGLDAAQIPMILNVPVPSLYARIEGYRAHFGNGGEPKEPG